MLVKNWMSERVITIDAKDSMQDAIKLLKEYKIRMLPVMKKGKLVGVVTDRDIKQASASQATTLDIHELFYLISKIKIEDIMTKGPNTVPPNFTVEETAEILLNNRISGVPVVDHEGNLVGIITQADLFRVLISLTGVGTRGIQFALLIKDQPGSIKEVADVIRKFGGRMVSILTSYDGVSEGYRKVYIRMRRIERFELEKLKKELLKIAGLLYMVDHRKDNREVYCLNHSHNVK
jgi:acetoin utilization protein AcuB